MLSKKNLDAGHIEDLVRIIIKNAKKIKILTDNILEAARIDSQLLILNKEEFDLVELVKDLLKDLKNQIRDKKISLILKCNEDSILLVADKLRINQVFLNLINNSINIVKEGEIIVSLERQDNNNTLLIRIIDNGPGIPSDLKDKLFMKFVTGSKSGTGLGLYICKNIIEKHGGKIWADNNNNNKGANFNFTLPISSQ